MNESLRDFTKKQMERLVHETRVQTHMVCLDTEIKGVEAILKRKLTLEQVVALRSIVAESPELSIGEAYMRAYGKA